VWLVSPTNTSRTCSRCGHTDRANRPTQATFRCLGCGFEANADVNAAVNIAARGRECEQAWQDAGAPSLPRRRSRRRPRNEHEHARAKPA
jgi:putative transposase